MSSRQLAFVIDCGGIRYAGSLLRPLVVMKPVVGGFWPLAIRIAACAVLVARRRWSFHTVIVCQPAMMFWAPCVVASWPLSGIGFSLWAFSATTTAFARPSLAAATASILLLVLTSICSKIVPAFWLSQAGTNCAGPRLRTFFAYNGFRTWSTPPLNRYEFASSWPPHSEATTGCEAYLWARFRPFTTPW